MKLDSITLYTIGHGRHSWQDFLALLRKFEVEFLCDVRSVALSHWVQFNGKVLEANLEENGKYARRKRRRGAYCRMEIGVQGRNAQTAADSADSIKISF